MKFIYVLLLIIIGNALFALACHLCGFTLSLYVSIPVGFIIGFFASDVAEWLLDKVSA